MIRARPTSEDAQAARRHRRKRRASRGRGGSLVGIRIAELERLFADRWGEQLPPDDAGRDDLFVLLNHAAYYAEPGPRMHAKAARWAPWLAADALADMIADIRARPLRWRADKLAQRLGVDDATRTRLALRTIGAVDVTAEQRQASRKERDRLAKDAQRRAAGVPRRPARPIDLSHCQPWRDAGVSRATWFRRQRLQHIPTSMLPTRQSHRSGEHPNEQQS